MFRIVASLLVIVVIGLLWFVFGSNRSGGENAGASQTEVAPPASSSDDEAMRKLLGK